MVLFVVVALLMAAAPMSAQPVSCVDVGGWTYKGQHHNQYPDGTWGWLTIDFRDKGVPWDDGICILDALEDVQVCGHNDDYVNIDGNRLYCNCTDGEQVGEVVRVNDGKLVSKSAECSPKETTETETDETDGTETTDTETETEEPDPVPAPKPEEPVESETPTEPESESEPEPTPVFTLPGLIVGFITVLIVGLLARSRTDA